MTELIAVTGREDGLLVCGHAGYAENGRDIVCAGVSALVQTLVCALEQVAGEAVECRISPGYADIRWGRLSQPGRVLAAGFFAGIGLIADAYPEYVKFVQAWRT